MSQRSNTIKAAGLYTFLSELQAPEGSLVKADNVNIDEMGVITPRRGFGDYSELPDSQERVKQILNYKKRIIKHYNGFLQYDDGQGNFTSYTQTINEVEPGFRIKSEEVNGNLYFTSSDGIKKLSANTSDQLSQIEINDAGVAKAVDLSVKVVPSTIGFLPPQSKVGYKILYGYKDNNNVLILGSPTSITIATNNSNKTVIPEQFELTFLNITGEDLIDGYDPSNDAPGTGKYFTVSTINTDYYIWFNLADAESGLSTEQPQDATTFGKIGIQVNVNSDDTPSEIVAKIANILDNDLKDFYDISIKEENTSTLIFTSKEEGDVKEAKEGTVGTGNLTINTVQEGKLIPGNNVNCEIETIIPDSIDRNKLPYFIQIYRTQVITATEELQLADISPGEECNLVYEQAVDLDPRSVFKYTDDTTNDFRDRGTPLYNNPFSGEGLLNSNERPPIAKDIESFNNYTFYSNTKTFHRSQFRFISVDDFKSGETSIFIGNEDILRQYIFRGVQEVTQIQCGTVGDTKENIIEENEIVFTSVVESTQENPAYVSISSRENENNYYLWYDAGNGIDPKNIEATNIPDSHIGLKVLISGSESKTELLNKTKSKLEEVQDFNTNPLDSLTGVFGDTLTDTFDLQNHKLIDAETKINYNSIEYFVKKIDDDSFQLYLSDPNVVFNIEDSIENVTVDPATDKFEISSNTKNLQNGSKIIYEGTRYYVIEFTKEETNGFSFKISTMENGSVFDIPTGASTSTTLFLDLDKQSMDIVNPYILNVRNSNAGFSDGISLVNQTGLQVNNITEGVSAYINLYSAEDELRYYIWFNKGNNIDPQVKNAFGIEVDLAQVDSTKNVSNYLITSLLDAVDFSTSLIGNTVVITNTENGNSTDANTLGKNENTNTEDNIGSGWSINIAQQGLGEDASINTCKWSINPSISISIEQTARSFVKVVNRDPNSPVNAFYLSAEEDVPGLILLENRNLEDKEFYVGVSNTGTIGEGISDEFDPSLPFVNSNKSLNNINNDSGDLVITLPNHDLNVNDEIYFLVTGDQVEDLDQIRSVFKVSEVVDQNIFKISNPDNLTAINTENTLMYVFKTDQVSENEEKSNRIYYSKLLQPESVPLGNFLDVGSKDQPIERLLALRDTLFILKTDGIYMLTGFFPPFNIRLLDSTSSIIAPDSAVVLNNQIYVLTDDGVAVITESGISIVSRPIEDRILEVTGQNFNFRLKTFGIAYDNDKAYIIWLPTSLEDETATQAYRYNYYERTWTRWTVPATCARVSANSVLYIGSGDRPVLQKERKNRDRTDYSDRNFTVQIPENSINQKIIRLNDYSEVEIGDVLVQEQYITIDLYNNLLLKLDLDPGTKTPASFNGSVNGINSNVEITAKTNGSIGNSILIKADGIKNLNELILNWNNQNIKNQAILNSDNGNEVPSSLVEIQLTGGLGGDYEDSLKCIAGDNIASKLSLLNNKLQQDGIIIDLQEWDNSDLEALKDDYNVFIGQLNQLDSGTAFKTYKTIDTITTYESIVSDKNTRRPDLNELELLIDPRILQGNVEVYKAIKSEIQWSPQHFGDPSAQKQFSKGTVIVDQNNFTKATVSYSSDLSQEFADIEKKGKGVGYYGSDSFGNPDLYWGGDGNDVPLLNIIPRGKQRGRYLNVKFKHAVAREDYRVLGITTIVRAVSGRGYK